MHPLYLDKLLKQLAGLLEVMKARFTLASLLQWL